MNLITRIALEGLLLLLTAGFGLGLLRIIVAVLDDKEYLTTAEPSED